MMDKDLMLRLISKYVPQDVIEENCKGTELDLTARGYCFLSRCFINDVQGDQEMIFSNFFKYLVDERDLPKEMLEFSPEQMRAAATVWQGLSTNVGSTRMRECFFQANVDVRMRDMKEL